MVERRMPSKTAWIMSEADTFELLNAIDNRLASSWLDQRHHDALVRLRAVLEEDLDSYRRQDALPRAEDSTQAETCTA